MTVCNAPAEGHKDWNSKQRRECPAHGETSAARGPAASAVPPSIGTSRAEPPSIADVVAMAGPLHDRLKALGQRGGQAEIEWTKANVAAAVKLATSLCPEAKSVSWEWCGDGDFPDALGGMSVCCPHSEETEGAGGSLGDYEFLEIHDAGDADVLEDLAGLGMSERTLAGVIEELGGSGSDSSVQVFTVPTDSPEVRAILRTLQSVSDQAADYVAENPRPDEDVDGRDAVREWENEFLDQAEIPDDEMDEAMTWGLRNAHRIDADVLMDPAFASAWVRNEYMLDQLRASS